MKSFAIPDRAMISRLASSILLAVLIAGLAGCSTGRSRSEREAGFNVFPNNYKADLLAAMHVYLNDPTGIRDAYVSEPAMKPVGGQNRYVACLRFNAKDSDGRYTGSRDIMAVFITGRFDQFIDQSTIASQPSLETTLKEQCGQADYRRFPELEMLSP
jgi:hypothetical protein